MNSLATVKRFFVVRENQLNTSKVLIRITKFTTIVSYCTHMMACLWYFTACPGYRCYTRSWVEAHSSSTASEYCDSLYWAMATMTTTGYGDVHSHSAAERMISIFAMIVGKLMYGFVLGNIASTLANADYLRVCYLEKMLAIEATLVDRNIPDALRNSVLRHHEYIWRLQRGLDMGDMFNGIPYTLHTDVSWILGEDLIRQVPLFSSGDSGFIAMLALNLRPQHFLKGDWLFKEGDISCELVFISSGYLQVIVKGRVVQMKHPNSFFGEDTVLSQKPHNASFRAATDIEALAIKADDLHAIIMKFPEMRSAIELRLGRSS